MTETDYVPDLRRMARLGFDEAVFCESKSTTQLGAIIEEARTRGATLLLTRFSPSQHGALDDEQRSLLDYDVVSRTAWLGEVAPPRQPPRVAVVTAGTSDVPVAREVVRTLAYHGHAAREVLDVGVAGLWRLLERTDALREARVVVVVAGMDAALPSVVAGLAPGAVIAVPCSTGYGIAEGGRAALHAALASCAPGLTVVNIDNGYGAACAALRILGAG
jgi:NCAIR mutase (PurE)-related protein